jgi:hypothetical protein
MTGDTKDNGRHFADLSATDFYQLAMDRMKVGTPSAAIEQELVARGLDTDEAGTVVQRVAITRRQRQRSDGRRAMMVGGVACVVGLAVTILSYEATDGFGGYYYFFPLAVAGGLLQFLWGLAEYRTA